MINHKNSAALAPFVNKLHILVLILSSIQKKKFSATAVASKSCFNFNTDLRLAIIITYTHSDLSVYAEICWQAFHSSVNYKFATGFACRRSFTVEIRIKTASRDR